MNLRALPVLLFTLSVSSAFAADETFEKTLTVTGAPLVSIATGSGYVHVTAGADRQVHLVGHVHAHPGWLGGDAEARVRRIVAEPPVAQSGNSVTVGPGHADSDLYRNISIDYDVTVPRAATLKMHSGSGGLQVTGIAGAVSGDSGSGSIRAEDIAGGARLETGSGSIHAVGVHGGATLGTGSGSLELALTAEGDVMAHTGSGSIHIDGVAGGLKATTGSGSIEIAGKPTAEWRVESGSGSIRLKVPADAKFTLNAETGSGTVETDRPILMQGSLNKHHVAGTVNGGGPTVRATTGSGGISVR